MWTSSSEVFGGISLAATWSKKEWRTIWCKNSRSWTMCEIWSLSNLTTKTQTWSNHTHLTLWRRFVCLRESLIYMLLAICKRCMERRGLANGCKFSKTQWTQIRRSWAYKLAQVTHLPAMVKVRHMRGAGMIMANAVKIKSSAMKS